MAKTTEGSGPVTEPGPAPVTAEADPPSLPVSTTTGETTPETAKVNPPLKFALKSLDAAHPYLTERGFTAETIAHFGVGMCTGKGIMAGRIAIPIHNEQGELVAYAGRWPGEPPDGEGKYKLPTGFHKSLVVYNLHRAKDLAKDQGLIVVEGFFDAMRLWQAGVANVVALMGSSLSDDQEALIVAAVGPQGKVALMFDEDEAGWKGREEALSRLLSRVHVKVVGLGEEGTQPDGLSPETMARYLGGL
jgi:DNA primase